MTLNGNSRLFQQDLADVSERVACGTGSKARQIVTMSLPPRNATFTARR